MLIQIRHRLPRLILRIALAGIFVFTSQLAFATVAKLSGTMPAVGDVALLLGQQHRISADGQRIVFLADKDADEVMELYSSSINGGEPVKLNSTLVNGGDVAFFMLSPDGNSAIYQADQDIDNSFELFSVPIDGSSSPTKLNIPLGVSGDVGSYVISPDSQWVIYTGCPTGSDCGVYSVPLLGPAASNTLISPTRAHSGVSIGPQYSNLGITPDSSRVVFVGSRDSASPITIFSAPIQGPNTETVAISVGNRISTLYPNYSAYKISPDGSHVVYLADATVSGVTELYSVPILGPAVASVRLNLAFDTSGDVRDGFQISPDSQIVAFSVSSSTLSDKGLYRVAINGPVDSAIKIADDASTILFSPNSQSIVFRNDLLFSISSAGTFGDAVALSQSSAIPIQIDSTSQWVIYARNKLYRVPLTGPASDSLPLSTVFTYVSLRDDAALSPDNKRLIYRSKADYGSNTPWELLSVPVSGPITETIKVNGTLGDGGNVAVGFRISPDSSQVVYIADQDTDELFELYVSDAGHLPTYQLFLPTINK